VNCWEHQGLAGRWEGHVGLALLLYRRCLSADGSCAGETVTSKVGAECVSVWYVYCTLYTGVNFYASISSLASLRVSGGDGCGAGAYRGTGAESAALSD
jgi:hypothetical protein